MPDRKLAKQIRGTDEEVLPSVFENFAQRTWFELRFVLHLALWNGEDGAGGFQEADRALPAFS